ncbi:MAG: GNAT family N-acetyltransferase [Huintestinicola sp.]|uniref:GNAT family N-acetyltransferase n=1 Tax=Huintestinicola sp. TaxID=2981661 RepID=UPI003F11E8D5
MNIEYVSELKKPTDTIDLYKALEWYNLSGYTDEDIEKANASFYSCYAYDGDTLVGLGRVASDGLIAAIMSGICVRNDYRRHGIGAKIVQNIVEYCQSGIYKLSVQIFCEDSLIPWYEGMGFEKMPVGMRKPMPQCEERSALKKNFGDIYGIDQITELSEDFYWYNFDAFGDFSYYSGIGSEGVKVPFIRMILYSNSPVKFSAELIFENVSEFEIGCLGVRTPLFGFDIICTEKYGYAEKKRYKIRSLEDDDICFFCEKFRIMSVTPSMNTASIACPERSEESISRLISGADEAEAEYDAAHSSEAPAAAEDIPSESSIIGSNDLSEKLKSLLSAASDVDELLKNMDSI